MTEVAKNLFQNFLLGGFITVTISYIATFFSPVLAAIWWAFPLSLLPSMYFMHKQGKSNKYISKFTLTTTYALGILFITTMSLGYFYKDSPHSFWLPIGKSVLVWLVLSIIYYAMIRYFKLEQYF